MPFLLVFSTAPTKKAASKLSHLVLDKRLAACVNITAKIDSLYWWKGKKQKGTEVIMLIKTKASCFSRLVKTLEANHPYSTPEIVAVPIAKGSRKYLSWLSSETAR